MQMDEIVVIGGGGHAKVLIAVLKKARRHVLGYTDPRDVGLILGVAYLGADDVLPALLTAHPECQAVIGVGKIDGSPARMALQAQVGRLGFDFPVVVSPTAVVNEEVELGPGTAVFDGAIINSGSSIGSACILNTGSIIEHDCRLGDNVHVAPGAVLSGGVTIGDHCMVGVGATVSHGLRVAAGCLIGAGAVVIGNLEVAGTYAGNPAKRIR
jgi:sugar O-acyltransferase (sialic acid O-acetyltransferase NeuD family)